MPHIKFFKDITKSDVAIAGGKGASLGEMTRAGIPVPPGFVVLSGAFDRFLEETDLKQEVEARLKEVNPEDTNSAERVSAILRDAIHDHEMPKDLKKEILGAYGELFAPATPPRRSVGAPLLGQEGTVAVRSSATAEDSSVASWAGELESFLNTDKNNLAERVKNCWSSLFTPRALFYRHEKKLIDHYVSVAVVVQKMVQSEISGIAFTVHPVTEDHNQMIIEAGWGLGEAIVSGQITPDSYVVLKNDLSIFDVNIGEQTRKLIRGTGGRRNRGTVEEEGGHKIKSSRRPAVARSANVWVELGPEGARQKLTGRQIVELAKICQRIEKHYGFPCDIEWAYEGGKFYITQSRPITTLKSK